MADVTLTGSPALDAATVPKSNLHDNSVSRVWTANGATVSASMIVPMMKIPHGAVIQSLEGYGFIGCASGTLNVGIVGLSDDFLVADITISSGGNARLVPAAGNLPYRVSLSDDSVTRYVVVQAKFKAVGSATVTAKIGLTLFYSMDQDSKMVYP